MSKGLIRIDPVNNVYEIEGKDFGQYCTGAEIKITPDNFPEVTLHLKADSLFCGLYESKIILKGLIL